jgi:ABC-type Fe3+/spermidine/putrescine transport system ATPase subunit
LTSSTPAGQVDYLVASSPIMMRGTPLLTLTDIHKAFEETPAVSQVRFDVFEGEVLALLGPSGSGKSTILMIIAGLIQPDHGQLSWKGESLLGVPPHRRGFGLMFQDFVLFPHMDVFENIAFGLRMAKLDPAETKQRVEEMLDLVGLSGYGGRDVHTLSGGEQQRVALARALAPAPRLLLLDEPLGSVDRTLRERLMVEVRQILKSMGQTAIYVTHDQEEAFAIADRVVVLRAGEIEQIGRPQEIYHQPASLFMARFLGFSNLLKGEIRQDEDRRIVKTGIGPLPVEDHFEGEVMVLLRPDAVHVDGPGECLLEGEVVSTSFRGSISRVVVSVSGIPLSFDFPSSTPTPAEGEVVKLSFNPKEALQVFSEEINNQPSRGLT